MKRNIIKIDESLCDGCGQCVDACAEGAIQLVDGKARLVSEIYCDGLGACIGDCPAGALTVEEREAEAFDEGAVEEHLERLEKEKGSVAPAPAACACPGSALRMMNQDKSDDDTMTPANIKSQLSSWPVQLMLVPPQAPFLKGADILLTADCVPFALPGFHSRYLKGKTLLIGCPKLDNLDFYQDKLKEILAVARPKSITVLKMEVPCCTGISHIALEARDKVLPDLPVEVHTIGIQGDVLEKEIYGSSSKKVSGGA